MKYKYILFDIDSTLIDFKKSFDNSAREVLTLGGHSCEQKYLDEYFKYNDEMWSSLNLNEISREDILRDYHKLYKEYIRLANQHSIERMKLNADIDDVCNCFMDSLGSLAVPSEHAVEVVKELSLTHQIYIATNGLNRVQPGKLTLFKEYLSGMYISEEVGYIKPQREYFNYIIDDIGCDRNECIMVGDSIPNDINGANNSGIASCYYNPHKIINSTNVKPTYEIKDFNELLNIFS